jgi:hypothetical protein
MNENKRVRLFLVVSREFLMTSLKYNFSNVATVHNYGTYPANYGDKAIRAASQGEMSVCLSCNH